MGILLKCILSAQVLKNWRWEMVTFSFFSAGKYITKAVRTSSLNRSMWHVISSLYALLRGVGGQKWGKVKRGKIILLGMVLLGADQCLAADSIAFCFLLIGFCASYLATYFG